MATPFFMATLGASMDFEVSMFLTIGGSRLLKQGVADQVFPEQGGRTTGGYLQDALEAGVKFKACPASMELPGLTKDGLLDQVDAIGGATGCTAFICPATSSSTFGMRSRSWSGRLRGPNTICSR